MKTMKREDHLAYCKICLNQKFDSNKGIICNLTDEIADFTEQCDSYEENSTIKEKIETQKIENELNSKLASQGKRITNYVIDMIFFYIFSILIAITISMTLAVISPSSLTVFDETGVLFEYLLGFLLGVIYYTILEAATGRTIGKFITKTKVVDLEGNKPNTLTILTRSMCRFIPFEAFSFLGQEGSGWHDKLSNTKVIDI
jgi:uncharacterized RDD family membrane protein YckC